MEEAIVTRIQKQLTGFVAALVFAVATLGSGIPRAEAAEPVTYLLPAPPFLPAFAPWMLAKHKGYFEAEGLDADAVIGRIG